MSYMGNNCPNFFSSNNSNNNKIKKSGNNIPKGKKGEHRGNSCITLPPKYHQNNNPNNNYKKDKYVKKENVKGNTNNIYISTNDKKVSYYNQNKDNKVIKSEVRYSNNSNANQINNYNINNDYNNNKENNNKFPCNYPYNTNNQSYTNNNLEYNKGSEYYNNNKVTNNYYGLNNNSANYNGYKNMDNNNIITNATSDYYNHNKEYYPKYENNNKNYDNMYYDNNYSSSSISSYNYYNSNYLNRYDYSSEERTNNFKNNGIYCGIKGLTNNGNNCFLNSTIQCLKHCQYFTKEIINEGLSSNGAYGEFKKLIENMYDKNMSRSLNVLGLKKAMSMYNNIYSDNDQHDSTIFFNDLLNALNTESAEEVNSDEEDDNELDEENFQIKYQKCISKSKINKYFSFFIKDLTIFGCGEESIDYQECYYLDLPIFDEKNRKIPNLEEALNIYTKKSYNYGQNTLLCLKHQRNEKSYSQNLFQSLPEILVISLKRVVNGEHIDHYFDYKEIIDMSKYIKNYNKSTRYELFAEILHYGGAYGGHKIAICKNFNTGIWYRFNDDNVTKETNIISSNAFLLFYKRI